ncbi:hypothetical protein THMIRHAS_11290 [Thiosulfatimonas sediminis]|uniref:Lipoprotein n=1 Tax=Thiosulfatimonas sediminis TaxID=2675054 RepID=A0A6F8PUI3_9GAMM|nr:hypothetical protein [Thiosulfatimonas sediminis]BBP45756.1 hypothetical protein THMIRHAS_11290 [Thiosulfatimonas sediminis]
MNLTKISSSMVLLSVVFFAAGCSVQGGAEKIGDGLGAIATSIQQFDADVQSEKVAENEFRLWQTSNESFKNFESQKMRAVSKQLCPIGYFITSRQMRSSSELKASDLECIGGTCQSLLEWNIRCQDVPEEPFSLFGKT